MTKALFYKDIVAIKKYAAMMLLLGVVCTLLLRSSGSSLIIMVYASSLLMTTLAIDERDFFYRRAVSDKGNRKAIVVEKYILLLILLIVSGVMALIMEMVLSRLYGTETNGIVIATTVLTGLALSSFAGGVTIPMTLKFGAEKARILIIVCYLLPAIAVMWAQEKLSAIELSVPLLMVMLIVFSVSVLTVSAFVSIRIFQSKDL